MHMFTQKIIEFAQRAVIGGVFLLPLVFLPAYVAPIASLKSFVLFSVAYIPLFALIAVALYERKFSIPNHPLIIGAGLVVFATGLSTLFSSSMGQSFAGHGYERDTLVAIAAVMAFVITIPALFQSVRKLRALLFAIVSSFSVLALFQITRLAVGSDVLFPTFFSDVVTTSPIGSWNDLAVFAGLIVSLAMAFLFFYPARRFHVVAMTSVLIAGLFLLAIVNLQIIWAILAFVVFFLAMYRLAHMSIELPSESTFLPERSHKAFIVASIVFACAITFLLFGQFLGARIGDVFDAQYVDVRPSWQGTIQSGSTVYEQDALLGSGPSTFDSVWVTTRDQGVNESLFWDADFSFGIGMLPTFFITTGLVGGLAWLVLVGAWVYGAIQFLRTKPQDMVVHGTTVLWLVSSGYALAVFVLYVPSITMFAFVGISVGAFLSALMHMHIVTERTYDVRSNTLLAFVAPTVLGIVLLAIGIAYIQGVRASVGSMYTTRASVALSENNLDAAKVYAARSDFFAKTDTSAQVHTAIALASLNATAQQLASTEQGNTAPNREVLQGLVQEVVSHAQEVTRRNPDSFRNWLFVANIYERVAPVVGSDALVSAATAYEEARKRAPESPLIPLLQARLLYAQDDTDGARAAIKESISRKSNYTDAYFLLSQIEIQEGNAEEAARSTESAVLLSPNNPGLRFQLGFLLYALGNYQQAAQILETAVTLNPNYANALYFLGLSLDRLGDSEAATQAFAKVLELNPDNEEVQAIVSGLRAGVSAVQTLQNRQSVLPAERDALPVTDEAPVIQ